MFNDGAGGAGASSSPTLTNVTFDGNSAIAGGAVYNNDGGGGNNSPTFTNVTFYGNSATGSSATGNGGAIYFNGSSGTSSPKFINATFSGNSASNGGALYNSGGFGAVLIGSILWGDTATTNGAEVYSPGGETTSVADSIVEGGCAGFCGGSSIVTTDPKLGVLADNGGFTRTLLPGADGAGIDALVCGYADETPLTDQRGAVRPDSASGGSATRCDMGAVEADSLPGDLIFATRFGAHSWDDF
jgi:hypothetical protein